MKDLICLFPPCDDIIDPLGSGRGEGGDEGFHHTFVEFRRLLDENDVLLGILRIITGMSEQNALPETKILTLRICTSVAGKMTFILTSRMDLRRPKYQEYCAYASLERALSSEPSTNDVIVINLLHIVDDLSEFCGG